MKHSFQGKYQKVWALLAWLVAAALLISGCNGGQSSKVYKVGVLSGLDAFAPAVDGLKTKMTELGYIEGKNITYDVQSTDVDIEAYQSNSIREPGGNITGVRFPSADIASKRLQILLELTPNAKRILVPYLKDYPNVPGQLDLIRTQAKAQGVELVEFAVASPPDLQAELDHRAASGDIGFDAILQIAEPVSITPAFYSILGQFSYDHQIPIGGALMERDGNSSIFGLLPQADVAGGQSALLADKIFKGTPAGTIPVVTAEGYFQINTKAAQALGVTVPEGLLNQANEVIR
jgi:putative ABC transport system substrate-binding protein